MAEAVLVVRDGILLLEEFGWLLETEGRFTELLLTGLAEWPLSVWETDSLEALAVEDDLTADPFFVAIEVS